VFIRFAQELASLSTCQRLLVGCVIIPQELTEVLAIGYNGQPASLPNNGCRKSTPGNCGCIHAESNALIRLRDRRNGLILITTHSPCEHCAGLIINSGQINTVIYIQKYRDESGLRLLDYTGIPNILWSF
jgi:deoxycytidylate deaminase